MTHGFSAGRRRLLAALCIALAALLAISCTVPGADRADRTDAAPGHGRLSALRVTGGEGLFPAFDPGVHHYAVRCEDGTTLQIAAQAVDSDARLTLLHNGRTTTGAVEETVTVNSDHDIAIEVRDGRGTSTYYVHCIPLEFPDITIEKRTAAVTDGLLLMTPGVRRSEISWLAIVDNNGVPRWVRKPNVSARNFRHYADGRYSYSERAADGSEDDTEDAVILDAEFNRIDTATLVGDLLAEHTGGHDFLITDRGTYLLMSYYPAERDLSGFECEDEDGSARPCSTMEPADDSVIQEVTPAGDEVFRWNSWDHLKIADCTIHRFPNDYAHLNSLHELDGDIVASLRGCAQVVRIERATGAVVWQMGGTLPMRADRPMPATGAAAFLKVVDDPAEEFCGQHHVTATTDGRLLMFDNGNHCLGGRKNERPFTRIVEYDISSGTEARWVRDYRLPPEDGISTSGGGVVALAGTGHWLITWGNNGPMNGVSEVDTTGTEIFRLSMSRNGQRYGTARVYRESEATLRLQPNLPDPR